MLVNVVAAGPGIRYPILAERERERERERDSWDRRRYNRDQRRDELYGLDSTTQFSNVIIRH